MRNELRTSKNALNCEYELRIETMDGILIVSSANVNKRIVYICIKYYVQYSMYGYGKERFVEYENERFVKNCTNQMNVNIKRKLVLYMRHKFHSAPIATYRLEMSTHIKINFIFLIHSMILRAKQ